MKGLLASAHTRQQSVGSREQRQQRSTEKEPARVHTEICCGTMLHGVPQQKTAGGRVAQDHSLTHSPTKTHKRVFHATDPDIVTT